MRKHILTSLVLIPFLMTLSDAAQTWSVDPSEHAMVFSSEDSGSNSYLGVDIADVTGERVNQLKLKEEKGVEITMVDQDAPAGKAGIKEHDVILTMNGAAVDSAAQLRRMIHETPPGRIVTLGLSRDGQPLTVKVQLGDKGKEYSYNPKAKEGYHIEIPPIPPIPPMPEMDIPSFNMVVVTSSPRSGLTVENITPQLGEFFGVKNGTGVLVRAVAKGSRAERAGFRAGDVIVKVNDQPVHDTSDFTHAVRSRDGSSVNVGVVRDKREQTIALPMPDRKDSGEMFQEESLDYPLLGDAYPVRLREVREEAQEEVARLEPEIRLAADDAGKDAEEIRKSVCENATEARREAEDQRQEARQQVEEQRREADAQRREARQEAEEQQREAEQQRKEAEEQRREALREAGEQRREMLREAEQQQREARQNIEQQQREYRQQEQQLQEQMRRISRQLRKTYLDI
jgi:serine protease Do